MKREEKLALLKQVRWDIESKKEEAFNKLSEEFLKEPTCSCEGWGCLGCCGSGAEIRARQGTFS